MGAFFYYFNIYNKHGLMPRLARPEIFHPRLQFRYALFTTRLPAASIYARAAEQPSFTNNPVTIDYMSNYYKMKGKTRWNDITLSCYQFEGVTGREIYKYMNTDHFNINEGVDKFADEYKHKVQLLLLSPLGIPTEVWNLEGAFIANASWGNMDWGNDGVMECEVTISYDFAELQ